MIKVLFVCMGNICRSPTAEGVLRRLLAEAGLADQVLVDSAGTHDYHAGKAPDPRARQAALGRGIDIGEIRARQVEVEDFGRFEYILAMDQSNYEVLMALCPAEHRGKVRLFLDFAPRLGTRDVPDPYYGGRYGFERVLDMVEEAALGLVEEIRAVQPAGRRVGG